MFETHILYILFNEIYIVYDLITVSKKITFKSDFD